MGTGGRRGVRRGRRHAARAGMVHVGDVHAVDGASQHQDELQVGLDRLQQGGQSCRAGLPPAITPHD